MNKIAIISWPAFQAGFDLLLKKAPDYLFISKLGNYRKLKLFKRLSLLKNYDTIHYFWGIINFWEILFSLSRGKKIVIHFIGSDVLILKKKRRKLFEVKLLEKLGCKIVSISTNLKYEMSDLGIETPLVPFVNIQVKNNLKPLPEQFSILAYVPTGKESFYNLPAILQCAKQNPEINFSIFPIEIVTELPNIKSIKYIEHQNIIAEINKHTLFVRITEHDGLPNTIIESLSCARHVAWTGDHPFCYKIDIDNDLQTFIDKLRKTPSLNIAGMDYVVSQYSESNLHKSFFSLWGI